MITVIDGQGGGQIGGGRGGHLCVTFVKARNLKSKLAQSQSQSLEAGGPP